MSERCARARPIKSLREGATIGRDRMRRLRQYTSGQRNIAGDDHIAGNDLLGDPIVGRRRLRPSTMIRAISGDRGICMKAVGDDESLQAIARGDFIRFIFHGAGVAVDVDLIVMSHSKATRGHDRVRSTRRSRRKARIARTRNGVIVSPRAYRGAVIAPPCLWQGAACALCLPDPQGSRQGGKGRRASAIRAQSSEGRAVPEEKAALMTSPA